jgi:transcriptional regulator of acetoin/glycerol metabolism
MRCGSASRTRSRLRPTVTRSGSCSAPTAPARASTCSCTATDRVVNYDIPFNPNRLEQRIGRLDRYGQTQTVQVKHFVGAGWEHAAAGSYERDLEFLSRARGRHTGRPHRLTDAQARQVRALRATGESIAELMRSFGVSRATIYRALAQEAPIPAPGSGAA